MLNELAAIERAEMDRLLLWALPSNKESEATRLSRFKKDQRRLPRLAIVE
jgi:hypothetical protein